VFSLHGTRKLLDRAKAEVMAPVLKPTTALGNWYGTVLFWRPQAVLLANEKTLFPVLLPLAPAVTLMARIPDAVRRTLSAHNAATEFIESEVSAMVDGRWAKTANRSVLGVMNEFSHLGGQIRGHYGPTDFVALALALSEVPCGTLFERHVSPDRELDATVAAWITAKAGERK